MVLLILGVALWWGAHLFKRLAPAKRAQMTDAMGDGSKGVVAVALLLSVVLMVVGYKWADVVPVYAPPSWTVHLNNLMMFVVVVLFGMGSSKGVMRSWFRHPMLMGFALWAIAHLLVNGDMASLVLFAGLLVWALVEIVVINRAEPEWEPPEPGPVTGDIRLLVISVVVFGVIVFIHQLVGPWPLPG